MSSLMVGTAVITKVQLAESFALNARIVRRNAEGLSDASSLARPSQNVNCLNWVLGHILDGRDSVLALLGKTPLMREAERALYVSGSPPITAESGDAVRLARLLEILDRGQQCILDGLAGLDDETLERPVQVGDGQVSLGRRLHGFYFHDTYHTGQIEILADLAK